MGYISLSTKLLIQHLESLNELDSRYQDLKCVNIDGVNRKGVCSVVFRAKDILEDEYVAIKFYDPNILGNEYYLTAFRREPVLLDKVKQKARCLTLLKGIKEYEFKVPIATGGEFPIQIPYFVTEWITDDIEDYFYYQQNSETREKLEIFRLVLLSITVIGQPATRRKTENIHFDICDVILLLQK